MTLEITRRASLALIASAAGSAALAQTSPAPSEGSENSGIQEFAIGDENAPIQVVEYASFTCPHCANFHRDVLPLIKANYVDTGKIRLIYRPVYFDGPGLWADMAARCAKDNDQFFAIADILYEQQAEWSRAGSQAGVAAGIVAAGRQGGLDEETILACLQDNDTAQALVTDFQINAERDGINSTPSFVIDGVLTPNMSYESFVEIFEAKMAPVYAAQSAEDNELCETGGDLRRENGDRIFCP